MYFDPDFLVGGEFTIVSLLVSGTTEGLVAVLVMMACWFVFMECARVRMLIELWVLAVVEEQTRSNSK